MKRNSMGIVLVAILVSTPTSMAYARESIPACVDRLISRGYEPTRLNLDDTIVENGVRYPIKVVRTLEGACTIATQVEAQNALRDAREQQLRESRKKAREERDDAQELVKAYRDNFIYKHADKLWLVAGLYVALRVIKLLWRFRPKNGRISFGRSRKGKFGGAMSKR